MVVCLFSMEMFTWLDLYRMQMILAAQQGEPQQRNVVALIGRACVRGRRDVVLEAGVREATLTRRMNHGSESGRNVPPRPAPLTFTFHCGATDGAAAERARHSHGARGPQRRRALLRARTTRHASVPHRPGLQCTTVHHEGFSFSDNRGESRNRVADKRCATRCARNSRVASHSPAGSVSQVRKWRKRREAVCAECTPWIALQILHPSHLTEPLGEHSVPIVESVGERRSMRV